MAFNYKYTRLLAYCQTGLAILTIVFGIVDRATLSDSSTESYYYRLVSYRWPAIGGVPIWVGIWFLITGLLGIVASKRKAGTDSPSKAVVGTYLGFSITSTVLAATMIICYAISISALADRPCQDRYRPDYSDNYHYPYTPPRVLYFSKKDCQTVIGIGSMLLLFAVLMFGINIWAAVCSCIRLSCTCCKPASAQPQVVYLNAAGGPNAGYVMVQGPGGNPMLVPAVAGPMTAPSGTPVQMQAGSMPVMVQAQSGGAPMVVPAYGGQVQIQGGQMASGQVPAGYPMGYQPQQQLAAAGYQPQEPQAAGPLPQKV